MFWCHPLGISQEARYELKFWLGQIDSLNGRGDLAESISCQSGTHWCQQHWLHRAYCWAWLPQCPWFLVRGGIEFEFHMVGVESSEDGVGMINR